MINIYISSHIFKGQRIVNNFKENYVLNRLIKSKKYLSLVYFLFRILLQH